MAERRTIGQILMSFGRITDEDVAKALEFQQKNGGYFGEALLALGYVSPEELEWGLAAQFDLPYVHPEVENIDLDAATLVTAEWALTHLTLPIMRTADTLTVIVDSPIKTEAVDQLQSRTDLRIELALAPAGRIREIIQEVFSGDRPQDDAPRAVATLGDLFGSALEAGSPRFGLSIRGAWAHGWYEERGSVRRIALAGGWRDALEEYLTPSPREQVGDRQRAIWNGQLSREGMASAVQVHYLGGTGGAEYMFRPEQVQAKLLERFSAPPPGLASEVRLLAQSGAARFVVTGSEGAKTMLPYLPALLFDSSWRSVHLTTPAAGGPDDVFWYPVDPGLGDFSGALDDVRAFHFDAATARLEGDPATWCAQVLDVAASTFVWWDGLEDRRHATDAGIRWEIRLDTPSGGPVEWSLRPLRS